MNRWVGSIPVFLGDKCSLSGRILAKYAQPANRSKVQALRRLQSLLGGTKPDAGMASALPPGAWWEHASNMSSIVVEPYGADAGDAAVVAARSGPLELRNVCFTYPLRPTAHGDRTETLGALQGLS